VTRLTGVVLRHKLLVVLAWLAIAAAGFATVGKATSALSASFSIPGQAFQTDSAIQRLYHTGGFQNPPVVLTAAVPPGTAAGPSAAAEADRIFAAAARVVPGSRLTDQATTGDTRFSAGGGTVSFALVFIPPGQGSSAPDPSSPLGRAVSAAAPPGWQTGVTGLTQLEAGTNGGKGTSALAETLLGALGALLVLAFVFASFIALLPLLMAAAAIPATFLLVYALTEVTSVNFIVQYLIALIGLGVAIDYSLLIVTRWRENRAGGLDNEAAVLAAMGSAGRAVVFSGATVAISLLALTALPVAFLRGMGLAALFIPLVTVAVATTLLPALLAAVGPAVDRPRLRREIHASRLWTGWARLVLRHRAAVLAGGLLVVTALVIPMFSLRLGEPASSALAQGSPAQTALTRLEGSGIPRGVISPIDVLTTVGRAGGVAAQARRIPGVYTAFAADDGQHRAGRDPARRRAGHCGRGGHRQRCPARPRRTARRHRRRRPGRERRPVHQRCLRQLPADAQPDRRSDAGPAGAGVPLPGAGRQGGHLQPDLARRGLRGHGAGMAAGPRQPRPVVHPRDRGDHRVRAPAGLRLPVRAVDGLRGIHPLPRPRRVRRHRLHR
jgi:RND superfamily putative drug exporter